MEVAAIIAELLCLLTFGTDACTIASFACLCKYINKRMLGWRGKLVSFDGNYIKFPSGAKMHRLSTAAFIGEGDRTYETIDISFSDAGISVGKYQGTTDWGRIVIAAGNDRLVVCGPKPYISAGFHGGSSPKFMGKEWVVVEDDAGCEKVLEEMFKELRRMIPKNVYGEITFGDVVEYLIFQRGKAGVIVDLPNVTQLLDI